MLEYNIFNYRVKGFTRFVGKYAQAEGSDSDPVKYIYS